MRQHDGEEAGCATARESDGGAKESDGVDSHGHHPEKGCDERGSCCVRLGSPGHGHGRAKGGAVAEAFFPYAHPVPAFAGPPLASANDPAPYAPPPTSPFELAS